MQTAIFRCFRQYRVVLSALLALWLVAPAGADELADFRAAVERASAQYRVALQVLESSGPDETAAEVQRFREAWHAIMDKFGTNRPSAFDDDDLYATTLTEIDARVVGALIVIGIGRREAARDALTPIGDTLSRLQARSAPPAR